MEKVAAVREGVAATEDDGFDEVGVERAEREWGVVHVLVEEVKVVTARRGDGGEVGVEEEVGGDGGFSGFGGGGAGAGGGLEASEVVDGGAYGVELVEQVVRDRRRCWGGCWIGGWKRGGREREDIGGYHGQEEKHVETHCETHFLDFLDFFCFGLTAFSLV